MFFSHAGENYNVGNTRRVADAISDLTGADKFEIVAEKDYNMPFGNLIKLSTEEGRNSFVITISAARRSSPSPPMKTADWVMLRAIDLRKVYPNATVLGDSASTDMSARRMTSSRK